MEKSLDITKVHTEKPACQTISMLSLGLLGLLTAEFILIGTATAFEDAPWLDKPVFGRVVTALTTFVTMLPGVKLTWKTDQRIDIFLLIFLLVLAGIFILTVSNLVMFLIGRLLLGIVLGIFSVKFIAMARMLDTEKIIVEIMSKIFPRIFLAGGAVVVLGPVLEKILGYTASGLLIGLLVILSVSSLRIGMPEFKSKFHNGRPTLIDLWANRPNRVATLVVVLLFAAQFIFIMYLRPFLEVVTDYHGNLTSVYLMTFIICYFLGSWLCPAVLKDKPHSKMIVLPLISACLLWIMVFNDQMPWLTYTLIILLGLLNGSFTISWAKWLTQNFSVNGSFLLLAVLQISIALGAASAGIINAASGVKAVLAFSGLILLVVPLCILTFCSGSDLNKTEITTHGTSQRKR